ncbi:MAG TPA: V-type ATP synthase subunit D [Candidatus Limivivens merdigallinarum]|uniref:V-type ATP synthase subunit D n=1 Tax=Candidatus Limivivens merdigallinarum TaxID=2840859 RepID=A0A9D0ZT85_9FIRM|nr:V-type ATP synthase subunit D [Candidatus Limivivens merdigallinarum]
MNPNTFPTKGNLILAKNSLALARQGYDLMDKKRNILMREIMGLISQASDIQGEIDKTFREAYALLQKANIEMGIHLVEEISFSVPVEESVRIKTRSVMGTEIPLVEYKPKGQIPTYAFYSTTHSLDEAKIAFEKVKDLTIRLSMIENAAVRLATNIKKTQKRANALKNITIPMYESLTKSIQNALEEKDREEFTRLKVIKRMQGK